MVYYLVIVTIIASNIIAVSLTSLPECIGSCESHDPVGLRPHVDCSKYCICDSESLIVESCKPGHLYDHRYNGCVDEIIADCAYSPSVVSTISSSKVPVVSMISSSKAPAVSVFPKDPPKSIDELLGTSLTKYTKDYFCRNIDIFIKECRGATLTSSGGPSCDTSCGCIGSCPSDPKNTVLLPHQDCDKYCFCEKGYPIVKECTGNYHFSTSDSECRPKEAAKCDRVGGTVPKIGGPVENPDDCKGSCGPNNYPYKFQHKDCSKYCVCIERERVVKDCEPDLHYSVAEGRCIEVWKAECDVDCECIGKCPVVDSLYGVILLAHHDCEKYCECRKGYPIVRTCNKGKHFSVDERMCLPEEEVKCKLLHPYTPTIRWPGYPDPNDCKEICTLSNPGLISHEDCSKYCICSAGSMSVIDCPSDKHFSIEHMECVDPFIARCEVLIYPPSPTPRINTPTPSTPPTDPPTPSTPPTDPPAPPIPDTDPPPPPISSTPSTDPPTPSTPSPPPPCVIHTPPPEIKNCIGLCSYGNNTSHVFSLPDSTCKKQCLCVQNETDPYLVDIGPTDEPYFNYKTQKWDWDNSCWMGPPTTGDVRKAIQNYLARFKRRRRSIAAVAHGNPKDCIGNCSGKRCSRKATLLPHKDHTKLCLCAGGTLRVLNCEDGLRYDPKIRSCK